MTQIPRPIAGAAENQRPSNNVTESQRSVFNICLRITNPDINIDGHSIATNRQLTSTPNNVLAIISGPQNNIAPTAASIMFLFILKFNMTP